MIKRMMTTPIATPPRFLIISVIVNCDSLEVGAAGLAAASCHNKIRKLRAFVPRMLVRIVTVNPSKRFYYSRQEPIASPLRPSPRGEPRGSPGLLADAPGTLLLRKKIVSENTWVLSRRPG